MTEKKEATFDENKSLSQVQFEKYLAANGPEKAQGYLDALKDFTLELNKVLRRGESMYRAIDSPNRVRTKLIEYRDEKICLIKIFEQTPIITQQKPKTE